MELTKPFEVGKTYMRVDGKEVTCIAVKDTPHYESAQFSDFEENHYRVLAESAAKGHMDIVKSSEGWDNPMRSGWRYNRADDRGRGTGSAWGIHSVIPEPRDEPYVLEFINHLRLSYKES